MTADTSEFERAEHRFGVRWTLIAANECDLMAA